MTDIENYKRAIAWLERGFAELQRKPDDKLIHLSVFHQFEVVFNVSEEVLRTAYDAAGDERSTRNLSTREVIRMAPDSGIILSTNLHWLEYGLALEKTSQQYYETADVHLEGTILPLLPRFLKEAKHFAAGLATKAGAA